MTYLITIAESGVSIKVSEVLYDADGNAVQTSGHRKAVGVGDYDTPEQYQAAVEALLAEHLPSQAALLAEAQVQREVIAELQAQVAELQAKLDALTVEASDA